MYKTIVKPVLSGSETMELRKGRGEDVEVLFRCNEDGEDQE